MNRGAAEPRPLHKFRPRTRNVQQLLDPDVLDDETRRLLLADVMHAPPAVLPAGSPRAPLSPIAVHSPPSSASPKQRARRPAPRAPLPGVVGAANKDGAFAHNLRERVSTGSEDVITAMAARLARVERQLTAYQAELKEMHARYAALQAKYDAEHAQRAEDDALLVALHEEKKELQTALAHARAAMQSHGVSLDAVAATPAKTNAAPVLDLYEGDYVAGPSTPRASVAAAAQQPSRGGVPYDVALLVKRARTLSEHVDGAGVVVARGRQGGLHDRDVVRVVLYKNGICVNGGPFRPYGWPLCDAFLGDLADGFYPYEFKERYPHGFPIELTDKTDEDCPAGVRAAHETAKARQGGGGRRLGDDKGTSGDTAQHQASRATPPGGVVHGLAELQDGGYVARTRADFVQKLPEQRVSANGHLVNVRATVAQLIGHPTPTSPAAAETPMVHHVTQCERRRAKDTTPSHDALVDILVRLASGQRVLLRLAHASTVGELHDELARAVPELALRRFELCEGLPFRRLDAPSATLRELGWGRNVALLVRYLA